MRRAITRILPSGYVLDTAPMGRLWPVTLVLELRWHAAGAGMCRCISPPDGHLGAPKTEQSEPEAWNP